MPILQHSDVNRQLLLVFGTVFGCAWQTSINEHDDDDNDDDDESATVHYRRRVIHVWLGTSVQVISPPHS